METKILNRLFLAISLLSSFRVIAQEEKTSLIHVGLIYPISSHGKLAAEYSNKISIHALAGLSKNETGVAVAGVANLVKENASGVLVGGVANVVGSATDGVQVAGFMNIIRREANGLPIAGFLNLAESAGAAQVAGFANITKESVKGVQIAGFMNSARDANTQIAGFINVAKKVKGVQISGFINIAESSDYPIGFLNLIKNGEKSIALTVDETANTIVSFRSGGRILYGILGVGYNLKSDNKSLYGIEAGMGAHIPVADRFRVNAELATILLSDFKKGDYSKHVARLMPAFSVTRQLEIFAGPSFNFVELSKDKGGDLTDHYLWSDSKKDHFRGLSIGYSAGVQYKF